VWQSCRMLRGLAQCQLQCLQDCRCVLLAPRPAACRSLLVQAAAARRAGCSWQGSPCLAPPRLQPCAPTLQRVHSTSSTVEAVTTAKKGKLCLIDGHNLAYRAFYGIFKAPMTELKVCAAAGAVQCQRRDVENLTMCFCTCRRRTAYQQQSHLGLCGPC
jgi:hypothetical protein